MPTHLAPSATISMTPQLTPWSCSTMRGEQIAASDYVPDYAFTAIALNLDWGERNRDAAVRCLRAMREAVQWTSANVDEASAILRRRAHFNDEHSRRALTEMFDRNVSPIDLRINRKAIEVVFDTMHRFGLYENCWRYHLPSARLRFSFPTSAASASRINMHLQIPLGLILIIHFDVRYILYQKFFSERNPCVRGRRPANRTVYNC
jgi:hypothetical protein